MQEHPGIPTVTVHDSVMTHARHLDAVAPAILEAFGAWGNKPMIMAK